MFWRALIKSVVSLAGVEEGSGGFFFLAVLSMSSVLLRKLGETSIISFFTGEGRGTSWRSLRPAFDCGMPWMDIESWALGIKAPCAVVIILSFAIFFVESVIAAGVTAGGWTFWASGMAGKWIAERHGSDFLERAGIAALIK